MQRFGGPLISILGSKSGPIICAIVLIAGLETGSMIQAQSVATRTTFTDSIKEPANVTVNGAVNKNAPTVVRSQLTDAEAQATIDFSIALKMRNFAELQQRVGMGEIIPLEEMEVKYFPASTDVESVRQWLIAQGFEALPAARYELSVFARRTGRPTAAGFRSHVRACSVPWRRAHFSRNGSESTGRCRPTGTEY